MLGRQCVCIRMIACVRALVKLHVCVCVCQKMHLNATQSTAQQTRDIQKKENLQSLSKLQKQIMQSSCYKYHNATHCNNVIKIN